MKIEELGNASQPQKNEQRQFIRGWGLISSRSRASPGHSVSGWPRERSCSIKWERVAAALIKAWQQHRGDSDVWLWKLSDNGVETTCRNYKPKTKTTPNWRSSRNHHQSKRWHSESRLVTVWLNISTTEKIRQKKIPPLSTPYVLNCCKSSSSTEDQVSESEHFLTSLLCGWQQEEQTFSSKKRVIGLVCLTVIKQQ